MPSPTIFSYTIEDEAGNPATSRLYVAYNAATETVGSLLGAAAAFGGVIDAVTDGVITQFNVTINALPDPAWKDSAAADSNVNKVLYENFSLDDSKYPWAFEVPAVKGSLIDTNGHPIIGSGAIDTMNDLIIAGSGAVFPNNEFLIDIVALRDAAVSFRDGGDTRQKSKVKA
jgi:hypothetical protein